MATQAAQAELEAAVAPLLELPPPPLRRDQHLPFLRASLRRLSPGHCSLDAARPWLVFWTVHSLALLGEGASPQEASLVARFLAACRAPGGGFGGGPGQQAHLAPTYAACASLATVGGEEAAEALGRPSLRAFLLRLKLPSVRARLHRAQPGLTRTLREASA